MIKAVLFDMDRLMFDTGSAYSIVYENMSARKEKVFTLEIKRFLMSRRTNEVIEVLNEYWSGAENVDDPINEQHENFLSVSIVAKSLDDEIIKKIIRNEI